MEELEEIVKIPTLEEVQAFADDECIRFPAPFEQYLDWVEKCAFNISYTNNEISIMGSASYLHERLVASIIFYLKSIFKNNKDLSFLGSNIKIHVQGTFSPNNFNADVSVVQGQPEFMILPSGKTSIGTILNPVLVVEVTSESTIAFDFGDKLIAYKKIKSLQQIIYINQYETSVSVFQRKGPNHWDLHDYFLSEDSFEIMGQSVSVSEIYGE